jgi:hypothetical protein
MFVLIELLLSFVTHNPLDPQGKPIRYREPECFRDHGIEHKRAH